MSCIVELLESRTLLSVSVVAAEADARVTRAEVGDLLAGLTALKRADAAAVLTLADDLNSSGQINADRSLLFALVAGQTTDLRSLNSLAAALVDPVKPEVNDLFIDYKTLLKQKNGAALPSKVFADALTLGSDLSSSGQQDLARVEAAVDSNGGEVQALKAIGMANAGKMTLARDITADVNSLNAAIRRLQKRGSLFRSDIVRLVRDAQSAFADAAM